MMLPVTLASAEANDNSDPCDDSLPQSFSTMVAFSPDATDITAAFARCAMSRTEAPVFANLVSEDFGGGAGVASATCTDADALSFFSRASLAFVGSANFGGSAAGAASASFGASTTFEASLCGADAANRSLNIIELTAAIVA